MSCTHDCGCSPEIRDARTDEWVQIAPESARAATLTPERPVKAPGQDENSQRPSEPVLPRRIKPEDVRPGMVIETRTAWEATSRIVNGRFEAVESSGGVNMGRRCEVWLIEDAPESEGDPDAELVERMAKEVHDRNCADVGCRDWDGHGESTRKAWREDARVVLRNLRAQGFGVTRAEQ